MKKTLLVLVAAVMLFAFAFAGCSPAEADPPDLSVAGKTDTTITVTAVEGAEYSKDGGASWQDSNKFTNLTPNTLYKITIRFKATETKPASAAAKVLEVTTQAATVTGFVITEAPAVKAVPGEYVSLEGGKISVSYSDGTDKEESIQSGWVSFDLFKDELTVAYGSFSKTGELNSGAAVVSDSAGLAAALTSATDKLILVKDGNYELTSSAAATYVETAKVIIGEGDAVINITGTVASQAAIIFKDNLTLQNIEINAESDKAAVKISTVDEGAVEKILFDSVKITGAGGLNFHGVTEAVLKNVEINVLPETRCVALSIAESGVSLEACSITNGAWGSIGIMYGTGYSDYAKLNISGGTEISSYVYVERYDVLGDVVTGLTGWEKTISGTTAVYFKP